MGWKYFIAENRLAGGTRILLPVIFPDVLVHDNVYKALRTQMPGWRHQGVRPSSAGMVQHVEAHGVGGRSETLGVGSKREDAHVIKMFEYFHGVRL